MPMSRKRAYIEIFKMGAYMAFPLCVYLAANRQYMYEGMIDQKLKKMKIRGSETATQVNVAFDVQGNTIINSVMDLTRKIDNFFHPKKD